MRFSIAIVATILSFTTAVLGAPSSDIYTREIDDAGLLLAERDMVYSEWARDFSDLEYEAIERRGTVTCKNYNYSLVCPTTHECKPGAKKPTRKSGLKEGTPENTYCGSYCNCT